MQTKKYKFHLNFLWLVDNLIQIKTHGLKGSQFFDSEILPNLDLSKLAYKVNSMFV